MAEQLRVNQRTNRQQNSIYCSKEDHEFSTQISKKHAFPSGTVVKVFMTDAT
jgi:hypothetical protein